MTRKYIISLLFIISPAIFAANDDDEQRTPRTVRNLTARTANAQRQELFPNEIENDVLSREQQLIFGLVVLNRRYHAFRNDGYAYYLRELLSVTGYSADEAKAIVERYNNNPEKYLSVLEKTKQNLAKKHE